MNQLPMYPAPALFTSCRAEQGTTSQQPGCDCESVWTCTRGRTRLCCELLADTGGQFQIHLLRNSRAYGRYQFTARESALTFAARLQSTFEGNGWAKTDLSA